MNVIKNNLVYLAKIGYFQVIAHGCNCFATMGTGIAKELKKEFDCDKFPLELTRYGDITKLGEIDPQEKKLKNGETIWVVNAYTQYRYGREKQHLNYDALERCVIKINEEFSSKRIGLPWIGCGNAGGDIKIVKEIYEKNLTDVDLTVVEY